MEQTIIKNIVRILKDNKKFGVAKKFLLRHCRFGIKTTFKNPVTMFEVFMSASSIPYSDRFALQIAILNTHRDEIKELFINYLKLIGQYEFFESNIDFTFINRTTLVPRNYTININDKLDTLIDATNPSDYIMNAFKWPTTFKGLKYDGEWKKIVYEYMKNVMFCDYYQTKKRCI